MFVLKGKIKIGTYEFQHFHEVSIIKSVENLSDTAVIKMPSKFKIRQSGEEKFLEEAIHIGDKVSIWLSYEDWYEGLEFEGYVTSISSKIPLEIKCEDAIWLLRRKNMNKAFGKVKLREVLEEIIKGTELKLASNIADYTFDKLILKEVNGAQILENLKKNYCLTTYINDKG